MTDTKVDEAYAFLRGHTTADIRFDENLRPTKYVIMPDGRLVLPVMVAMLRSVDTVLFIPDYSEGAMEVQVSLLEFSEHGSEGAAADRWRIYHGEPEDVRWAVAPIDAARFDGMVIDGQALTRPNPLAPDESRICKHMNQEHAEDLQRLCSRYGGMDVEQPVMVGIDPLGLDVRARFDVVRVPFTEPVNDAQKARGILQKMFGSIST